MEETHERIWAPIAKLLLQQPIVATSVKGFRGLHEANTPLNIRLAGYKCTRICTNDQICDRTKNQLHPIMQLRFIVMTRTVWRDYVCWSMW